MNKTSLAFLRQIRLLIKHIQVRTYRQILQLIFLVLLALISTISVPVLSAQQIEVTSGAISATSNAQLLLQQGIKLFEAENFAEAVVVWQKAASTFAAQKNNLSLALVFSNLSSAYQELGQLKEAEESITQSLNLLKNLENLTDSQTYLEILAKALNNQGSLEWAKGRLEEALLAWKKATITYAKAGNKTGIIGSLINQSQVLQELGFSRQAEKTLEEVKQCLQQESNPSLKAAGLRHLGKALRQVGKLDNSWQVLTESLKLTERSTAKSLALLELGNTERALANRAVARGKQDEGQKHTQAAMKFYQQAVVSAPGGQLPALLNQLSLLVEMGQRSEGGKLLPDIQRAIASLPASRTAIYARLNFAQSLTCLQSGIDNKAISCSRGDRAKQPNEPLSTQGLPSRQEIAQILANAVQQAQSLQDLRAESFALGQLGELYELSQQRREAQTLTEQAILRLESIQAPDIRYRWEWLLGRLLEEQGDTKGAISAYTTAVETLKSVRGNLLTINSDVQFSFRDNVEPIYRNLVDLLLRTDGTSEPSKENLKLAVENIDSLQLAELENFLGCNLSLTVQINQDIDKVDSKAAFIYPIILEDRLEVIFRLPGQPLKHYANPVRRTDVEKTLRRLRTALLQSNGGKVTENSQAVYKWLIEPIEEDLEKSHKIETLVFALDGELRNIPMAVLYDSKVGKYLIEKEYKLVLLPSSKLFDLRAKPHQLQVLGAGISEKINYKDRIFKALDVTQELEQIKNLNSSKILLNSKFTQQNIQQNINSGAFSVIHLATHGNFSSDPEETYILIHSSEGSNGELFRAKDLDNLLRSSNKKASGTLELLVLSACKTAEGDNRATLGLAGLAVRAGSRSTLATLWQVNDKSTVQLMKQFYQELNKPGVTKAAALHRAQQALSRDKKYQNPSSWAPYILVGNWL